MTSENPVDMRAAWAEGIAPLLAAPAGAMAPLLGLALLSVCERLPLLVHVEGVSGSGKTTLARVGSEFVDDAQREQAAVVWGAPVIGSTWAGITRVIEASPLGFVVVDDVVSSGRPAKGISRVTDLARYVRFAGSRIEKGRRFTPPLASVVTTSEDAPHPDVVETTYRLYTQSGLLRSFPRSALEAPAQAARANLGRAFESAYAKARGGDAVRENFEGFLLERWRAADRLGVVEQSESHDRVKLALAAAWGIQILVTLLAQDDAVPALERRAFTEWARDGIWESLVANCEPTLDGVTQIERDFREILREELRAGRARLAGWRDDPHDQRALLGQVRKDRVYVVPGVAVDLMKRVSPSRYDASGFSPRSVAEALDVSGVQLVIRDGKRSVPRRVEGNMVRVWDLPVDYLLAGLS